MLARVRGQAIRFPTVAPRPGWLKHGRVASFVTPKSSVRLRFLEPVKASTAEVFWIPENAILKVCLKLKLSPGRSETTLKIEKKKTAKGDIVTELWPVGNPNTGKKPAEYVAVAKGARRSTPLRVANELDLDHTNGRWLTEVDPAAIAAAAAGPAGGFLAAVATAFASKSPIKLKREGKKVTHKGVVRAAVDPAFSVQVLTMTSDPSLDAYLKDYVPKVARKLSTDSAQFVEAFYKEFAPYLSGGSYPGLEINPQSLCSRRAHRKR
jgi:hypothetical protein